VKTWPLATLLYASLAVGAGACGGPHGACVVSGGPTFPHCDEGVAKSQCTAGSSTESGSGGGAMVTSDDVQFYEDKSCKDVGYAIPCGPPASSNCFLEGTLGGDSP
jgi:hypothetical protein